MSPHRAVRLVDRVRLDASSYLWLILQSLPSPGIMIGIRQACHSSQMCRLRDRWKDDCLLSTLLVCLWEANDRSVLRAENAIGFGCYTSLGCRPRGISRVSTLDSSRCQLAALEPYLSLPKMALTHPRFIFQHLLTRMHESKCGESPVVDSCCTCGVQG